MSVRLQAEVISYRFGLDSAECDVKLVVPGTVERLRPQLARALERVGYHVVSEEPLQARRGGTSFSLNVLKYPLSLHIGFKPAGEQATQVTFSYSLKHSGLGWITKGDLPVFAQEAEAIAAVALQGARAPLCTRCGGENPAGSRFCRRCGALLAVLEPAELDVLNLVARNRAAYLALLTGSAGLALMTVCLALLLSDLPAKLERFVIFLGLLAGGARMGTPALGDLWIAARGEPPKNKGRASATRERRARGAASPFRRVLRDRGDDATSGRSPIPNICGRGDDAAFGRSFPPAFANSGAGDAVILRARRGSPRTSK
jgi:hypothetical protein